MIYSEQVKAQGTRDAKRIVTAWLEAIHSTVGQGESVALRKLEALISAELCVWIEHSAQISHKLMIIHSESKKRQTDLEELMRTINELKSRPPIISPGYFDNPGKGKKLQLLEQEEKE